MEDRTIAVVAAYLDDTLDYLSRGSNVILQIEKLRDGAEYNITYRQAA